VEHPVEIKTPVRGKEKETNDEIWSSNKRKYRAENKFKRERGKNKRNLNK
jgi:hypothetical protein